MKNKLNSTSKTACFLLIVSFSIFLFKFDEEAASYFYGQGLPFTPLIFRFTDFFEIGAIGFNSYDLSATNYFPFGVLVINLIFSIFGMSSVFILCFIFLLILLIILSKFFSPLNYFDLIKFFIVISIPTLFVFERGNINILLYSIVLLTIFLIKDSNEIIRALFLSFFISAKPTFIVVFLQILLSVKLSKKIIFYIFIFLLVFNGLSFYIYAVDPFSSLIPTTQFGGDPLLFVSRLSTNYIGLISGYLYLFDINPSPINDFIVSSAPSKILLITFLISLLFLLRKRPSLTWYSWITFTAPTFLIFPIISYYYNVLILLPAFIFWLRSPSLNKTMARIESILFAVMFNSVSWYHVPITGYSSNSFFVSLSVILLFLISLMYYYKSSRNTLNSSNSKTFSA